MPKKKNPASAEQPAVDFEPTLKALETLVERLEDGELSLEDALKDFEQGIELARRCQVALHSAEQKVQILLEKAGEDVLEPFPDEH